ncbi:MAG: hypothetical protein V4580_10835 [Bacteroidota bacterium]
MKKILILGVFSVLLFATSCTMRNKTIAGSTMDARLNFTTADLEYVGDVNGTTVQHYVFGLPLGGRRYHTASTGSFLGGGASFDRAYNNALYDALNQKPDADFVLPVSSETVTDYGFLGRRVTIKVRAKAFKLKSK